MPGSKKGERRGGRKKGTPNKATAEVKTLAQKHTREVIGILLAIAKDKDQFAAARVSACKELLDRGHGKSRQAVDLGVDFDPLTILADML